MADPVNWADPCARAAALGAAYQNLLTGAHESRVRFRNGDVDEDVTFNAPKLDLLRTEFLKAQAECTAAGNGRPARFCATGG